MIFFIPALGMMFVFFLLIPGIGAFNVRARWRNFRKNCLEASLRPHLKINSLPQEEGSEVQGSGIYRFCGILDAVGRDGKLWLKSDNMTVQVYLAPDDRICFLPDLQNELKEKMVEKNRRLLPDEVPLIQKYSQIVFLPLGTRIYLAGRIVREKGSLVFRSSNSYPLFFLVFKGKVSTFLRRAIWCGRQRNEYWNALTPPSLMMGITSMVLLSYWIAINGAPAGITVVIVLCALFPVLAFIPPGVGFYFLYRRLWNSARSMRAERDLISLPLRFFSDKKNRTEAIAGLPDGTCYASRPLLKAEIQNAINRGAKIRTTVLDRKKLNRSEAFIFGQVDPGSPGNLMRPIDPVTEYVITFGWPGERALVLQKKAATREILSLVFFVAAIASNFILALVLSSLLI